MKTLIRILCLLCALSATAEAARASISIPNPVPYPQRSGPGMPELDWAHNQNVGTDRLNRDLINGVRPPQAALDALARAGWSGAGKSPAQARQHLLDAADANALHRNTDVNGHSFAFNILTAYPEHDADPNNNPIDDVGEPTPPATTPTPSATPRPSSGTNLYDAPHELSEKLQPGTKARRSVGAFETAWAGARAFWEQAERDGVPSGRAELQGARDGLLVLYANVMDAYRNGQDNITDPVALAECQAAADAVWNAFHAARKNAIQAKASGYELVAGDPRQPTFQNSRLNRIAWHALSNLTTAAGLYGLRGEVLSNGQRDAEYVDAFMSFESQDPLRKLTQGSDGVGLPGRR